MSILGVARQVFAAVALTCLSVYLFREALTSKNSWAAEVYGSVGLVFALFAFIAVVDSPEPPK